MQSALSHRWEPEALQDWQASMQRRCLLHRFPCRLWYEFIYEWQVKAKPADPHTYTGFEDLTAPGPATTSSVQQTLCEIRVHAAPVILIPSPPTTAEPVTGQLSVQIRRL